LLLEPDLTFEAQRIVPLDAYTQDIEALMLQCQQKNAWQRSKKESVCLSIKTVEVAAMKKQVILNQVQDFYL